MSTSSLLKVKVRVSDFVAAGGIIKAGMVFTKDYVSFFPNVTVLRFDEGYRVWTGADEAQEWKLELEYLFIEIDILEFSVSKK